MHLNDSEWEVMGPVWAARRPVRAREVHEALAARTGWAYTTVTTLLDRLEGKGAVRETRDGRTRLYAALVTRSAARRSALGALLENAFGGAAAPLLRFVVEEGRLSREDRADLLRVLRREPGRRGKPR